MMLRYDLLFFTLCFFWSFHIASSPLISQEISAIKDTNIQRETNYTYVSKLTLSKSKQLVTSLENVQDSSFVNGNNKKEKRETTHLNPVKFGALTGVTLGAVLFLHNLQKHAWWSGARGPFHIQNDWSYALSMDKIGHFMEGGLIEKTMKGAFEWSGMDGRTAMWFGALFSIGYMTDIEIEDGFARQWGYSPGDELANLSGDVFSIAQDMWKPLQTVNLKWGYIPSHDTLHKGDFPDDYNGQVFWLSFDIHSYFGGSMQKFWPKYLNFALGYGVKGYEDPVHGRIQNIYLGFDFDMRKIIPGDSSFMKFIKEFLNTFKVIPTPAIKWNTSNGRIDLVIH